MKKQAKRVVKTADKVDAKLDTYVSKIPFVGSKIAKLTTGTVLLVVVGVAFLYIVTR